jgi:hypothetical protein
VLDPAVALQRTSSPTARRQLCVSAGRERRKCRAHHNDHVLQHFMVIGKLAERLQIANRPPH